MFKQAVKNTNAPTPGPKPSSQQQSLLSSFRHTTTQTQSTKPGVLSVGSGNVVKSTVGTQARTTGAAHGIKRTSSGLAKAIGSQEEFDYPPLNITDSGKDMSSTTRTSVKTTTITSYAPVFFDENDFDSDVELDVEDLAAKDSIQLPAVPSTGARDSGYGSGVADIESKLVADSSQPIPWSSSPVSHLRSPPVKPPQPTKRRTLPWLEEEKAKEEQRAASARYQEDREPSRKKRRSTTDVAANATPASKPSFPWNSTASAVKQQQKSLREAKKNLVKANDGTEEDVKRAIQQKKKDTVHRIFLSEEQKHILNLVLNEGKSVFFTGSAGTGKSVLLREIIKTLKAKYRAKGNTEAVAVTASTGLAACNIEGVTLHSFSGIALGKDPVEDLIKRIKRNKVNVQRWRRTKILIIDEISMVDGELFDKLEQIARTLRNNGRPFGGIQLVITGDFFQLPPVGENGRAAKFAFEAQTWNTSIDHTIGLHQVFRQKDPVFADMLNEMREGRMSRKSIETFKKLSRPLPAMAENIEATELYPTRAEVDRANNARMQQLHGRPFDFPARDGGTITDPQRRENMLSKFLAPPLLTLKKGAQVMLTKNMDEMLVNGSLGKVIGFMTEQMFEVYKDHEEDFHEGRIPGLGDDELTAQQSASLLGLSTQKLYPLVRFANADGTTRDLLCKAEVSKTEQPNGEVLVSREQIPLILAWALSIHKAQGQTLERVKVDLGKAFEKGQAYVALSRATHMDGLQVLRFDVSKVQCHEKVKAFYKSLSTAEQVQEKAREKSILGKLTKKPSEESVTK